MRRFDIAPVDLDIAAQESARNIRAQDDTIALVGKERIIPRILNESG